MARRGKKAKRISEESAWRTWWDQMPGRTQHLICSLLLVALSLSFFGPIHFTGKHLVGGDTVQWRSMAESMIEFRDETGEEPLWATNPFAGMPGYMVNYQDAVPQVDDAAAALRDVFWPSSHFLLLLVGTYLLVVLLTGNKLAGVLSAAGYGLTTYLPLILVAGHNSKFVALCFAPWLVLTFVYTLRNPRLLSALLFAIAFGANLAARHPQITYYIAFLLGIWWIAEGIGAVREKRSVPFAKATGWLVLGTLLGLAMVAQPYLVQFEYKEFSVRGAAPGSGVGGLDIGYAMTWSQGIGELVTLLIPGAYGGGQFYWGPKPFTAGPHYVGGVVVLLALLALWGVRRRAVWGLAVSAFVMTLFALGDNFSQFNAFMFEYFPFFDAFRAPETWLSVVVFALAVLAGFGAWYVARREADPPEEARKSKAVYAVTGGLLAVVLILWVGKGAFFDFERPGEAQQIAQQLVRQVQQRPDLDPGDPQVQQLIRQNVQSELARREEARIDLFDEDARRTLIFLFIAGALLVAYRRGVLPAWATVAGLALLVVLDLWGVDRRYFNEDQLVQDDQVESRVANYPFDDFLIRERQEAGGYGHFRMLSLAEGNPMSNARPAFYHETLGGYHGAKLRLYQDFIDHLFVDPDTGVPNEQMLDMMNVRYVVARGRLPNTEVVYRDEQTGAVVLRNTDALPRGFLVGRAEVVESPEETFERMQSASFEPGEVALLPEPIDFEPVPVDSGSVAQVELEQYGPNEIVWQVRTDAPRLLVASEVYYPAGWNAYVNGEQVPLYRANHLLRAVPVPEGDHTVVMRFEPRKHTLGLWITIVSTILVYGGVVLLLGLAWYRRRKEEAPEES